jgi:tripartite-type tricarboxylate transporter receptor subunit TctC
MANAQVREGLARVQIPIVVRNAAEFAAFNKDQYARFGEVIRAANLTLD